MQDQKGNVAEKKFGATMRLGAYPCELKEGTLARNAYGKEIILNDTDIATKLIRHS